MSQDTIVLIDSRDRISGTPEKFTVKLKTPIESYTTAYVKSVSIPLTFYNVTPYNYVISYTVGATPYGIAVPYGVYTIASLINYINDMTGELTFAYNTLTQRVSYQYLNNGTTVNWTVENSLGPLLGFLTNTSGGIGQSYISPYTLTGWLGPSRYVIRSSAIAQGQSYPYYFMTQISNVIQSVNLITSEAFVFQSYESSIREFGSQGSQFLYQIDVELQDDRGNPVSLNDPLQGWQLELGFKH
jgi:hypothetical protein